METLLGGLQISFVIKPIETFPPTTLPIILFASLRDLSQHSRENPEQEKPRSAISLLKRWAEWQMLHKDVLLIFLLSEVGLLIRTSLDITIHYPRKWNVVMGKFLMLSN